MTNIGTSISKGEFPIAPYQLNKAIPCSYCDYKSVCRFDNQRNRYHYLTKLSEDEALQRMKDELNGNAEDTTGGEV